MKVHRLDELHEVLFLRSDRSIGVVSELWKLVIIVEELDAAPFVGRNRQEVGGSFFATGNDEVVDEVLGHTFGVTC